MGESIRVLLVEDNQVFREALELTLGMRPDMEVVAAVPDGTSAAASAREVREACPSAAVICLTASATLRERDALTEAGVVACLRKDEGLDAVISAIQDAAQTKA